MLAGVPSQVVVRPAGAAPVAAPLDGSATLPLGGVEVTVRFGTDTLAWDVANGNDRAIALDAVAVDWDLGPAPPAPIPCWCNGYQSWAPARAYRLGVDEDPSRRAGSLDLVRAAYHADPAVAAPGELRSEQVAALALGPGEVLAVGFRGGAHHAGTVRMRIADGRVVMRTEAWLGGALLPPGTARALHDVVARRGTDASTLLEDWASDSGAHERARTRLPYQAGWCSWYHYFHDVHETALLDNLARAGDWPFEVFQLDDGYQSEIGDWLDANERFPSGVGGAASAIAARGFVPGIWLAPFLAAPGSRVAQDQPDWLARASSGEGAAIGMFHDVWGGFMWQLDTTLPDVQDHLARTAATLVAQGYRYLKLDFTFSPGLPGRFHDPTRTPAERVRDGYEAIRRGAGEDVTILGCGAPLGAVVGVVDAMRIGADVAPWWDPPPGETTLPGIEDAAPSTHHSFTNTLTRAFQHRRLWSNDPDCVMLRTSQTALSPDAARAWALTVGVSGGLALVSDDLALLGPESRRLLDEVLALGRASDAAALAGAGARCPDLLAPAGPTTLVVGGTRLEVDPATAAATLALP